MNINDVDKAMIRLHKRLDKILNCTSGMPNYEKVAAYIYKLRVHLIAAELEIKTFTDWR